MGRTTGAFKYLIFGFNICPLRFTIRRSLHDIKERGDRGAIPREVIKKGKRETERGAETERTKYKYCIIPGVYLNGM